MNKISSIILCVPVVIAYLSSCRESNNRAADNLDKPESAASSSNHRSIDSKVSNREVTEIIDKKIDQDSNLKEITNINNRLDEEARSIVFRVPLGVNASNDREKAWKKLTQEELGQPLSDEQCEYALGLLERYEHGSRVERLVFWRLVFLRCYEQGASGTSRLIGSNIELREKLRRTLTRILYLGLNVDSVDLPEPLAARKAVELLEQGIEID